AVHKLPGVLPLCEAQGRIDRQVRKALDQAARPADLQRIDLFDPCQPEVLFVGQAAKITSAADFAVLLAAAGLETEPRADRRAVALDSGQPHVDVVARKPFRAKYTRREQIARIGASRC